MRSGLRIVARNSARAAGTSGNRLEGAFGIAEHGPDVDAAGCKIHQVQHLGEICVELEQPLDFIGQMLADVDLVGGAEQAAHFPAARETHAAVPARRPRVCCLGWGASASALSYAATDFMVNRSSRDCDFDKGLDARIEAAARRWQFNVELKPYGG